MSFIMPSSSSESETESTYSSSDEENLATSNNRNCFLASFISTTTPVFNSVTSISTPLDTTSPTTTVTPLNREALKAMLNKEHPLKPISRPVTKEIPNLLSGREPLGGIVLTPMEPIGTTPLTSADQPKFSTPPKVREITEKDRATFLNKTSTPTFTPINSVEQLGMTPFGCHHTESEKKKTIPKVLSPFSGEATMKTDCASCEEKKKEDAEEEEDMSISGNYQQPPKSIPITSKDRQLFGLSSPNNTNTESTNASNILSNRIVTTLKYLDKLQSPGMKSMLSTGSTMNLASANHCSLSSMSAHIKSNHPDFYELLQANMLVPVVFSNQSGADIIIIIPDHKTLQGLVNDSKKVSEETRRVLLYHILKRGGAPLLQKVIGMVSYETLLDGKFVQVEEDRGIHRINGSALRSDPSCPYTIFHIRELLNPDEEQPAVEEEAPKEGNSTDSEETSSTDDEVAPVEKTNLQFIAARVSPISGSTTFTQPILAKVSAEMQRTYYNGSLEFGKHVMKPESETKSVKVAIITFDTTKMFANYEARMKLGGDYEEFDDKNLTDLSRVTSEKSFNLLFPSYGQKHFNYDKSLPFTEYECPTKNLEIKKSDLIAPNRLVGLSFTSPTDDKKHSVVLCKLSHVDGQNNQVYMANNENLLLRFKGDMLDTISINHRDMDCCEGEPLQKEHFIELQTSMHENSLYDASLNAEAFDHYLMTNGKISRYLRRRVHDAKKGAGKLIRKGERQIKKTGAIEVKPAPSSSYPSGIDKALESAGPGISETATIMFFSDGFNTVRPKDGKTSFSYEKHSVVSLSESMDVLTLEENKIGENIGERNPGKYITLQVGGTPKITMRVSRVSTSNNASQIYYAAVERDLYVLKFSEGGNLSQILVLLKSSNAAKRILASSK